MSRPISSTSSLLAGLPLWLLSSLATLLACGCANGAAGAVVEVSDEPAPFPTWDEYKRRADGQAFEQPDGSRRYNVEWDLWLTEDQLRDHYDSALNAEIEKAHVFTQISTGADLVYSKAAALHLRYCISDAFGSNKTRATSAVRAAMRDWQAVSNVHFDYVPAKDATCEGIADGGGGWDVWKTPPVGIDFAVMALSVPTFKGCSNGATVAAWRQNSSSDPAPTACPGSPLGGNYWYVLGLNYNTIDDASSANKAPYVTDYGVALHELGHILGLRHEHPWSPNAPSCESSLDVQELPSSPAGDTGGRQLGSTAYDNLSVMHYPQVCGGSGTDFALTPQDGVSIRAIYGMPAAWYVPII